MYKYFVILYFGSTILILTSYELLHFHLMNTIMLIYIVVIYFNYIKLKTKSRTVIEWYDKI